MPSTAAGRAAVPSRLRTTLAWRRSHSGNPPPPSPCPEPSIVGVWHTSASRADCQWPISSRLPSTSPGGACRSATTSQPGLRRTGMPLARRTRARLELVPGRRRRTQGWRASEGGPCWPETLELISADAGPRAFYGADRSPASPTISPAAAASCADADFLDLSGARSSAPITTEYRGYTADQLLLFLQASRVVLSLATSCKASTWCVCRQIRELISTVSSRRRSGPSKSATAIWQIRILSTCRLPHAPPRGLMPSARAGWTAPVQDDGDGADGQRHDLYCSPPIGGNAVGPAQSLQLPLRRRAPPIQLVEL